ncbi:armadillo-type protein [Pyronema domesticum]|nr:armadillo-type protein [Pyronema domesticum]
MSDLNDIFGPQTVAVPAERQSLFNSLKPLCVTLSKCILCTNPNPRELTNALAALHSYLQTAPTDSLDPKIADYIFFPLSHVFGRYQTLNDRALELALLCLEILLKTAWRVNVPNEMARQLLILLTFVIGGAPGKREKEKEKDGRSEETKLAGCQCLLQLFGSLERSGNAVLEEVQNTPALGHTVTMLLEVFMEGEMQELQLITLETLQNLLLAVVKDGDLRASFYPGVVSGLVRGLGLGKTTKRPYQVLREMVRMLDKLICNVLDDKTRESLPDTDEGQDPEAMKLQRTKPWMKATAANTKVALEQILKLRTHPRLEVRTAIFEFSRDLLETCTVSLEDATAILVETLVVIAGDDDENLAGLSANTIRVMTMMGDKIKEAVRSSLDRWITSLPRVMTGNDEDAKQRVITRLSIAFGLCMELNMESDILRDMLADGIKDSLLAINTASKKSTALVRPTVSAPKLDILLADRPATANTRIARFPDIIMSARSQQSTMESMKQLLSSLGQSSENGLILAQRHLRDAGSIGLTVGERTSSFWIAINLLRGSLSATNEIDFYFDTDFLEASPLQRRVTDELLSLALVNLTTAVQDDTETTENASIHCLALEALSLVAETQKFQFRGELVDALYPVVHHLGSSSPEVANHAVVALNNLAHACEYKNAKELLLENVDYMVNAVSLKLNIFDLSPQAPVVLNMMLKLVGPKLVPYLDDLVGSIFGILDGFHEYERLCEELFMVLGSIVEESSKGDEALKQIEGPAPDLKKRKKRSLMFPDDLVSYLRTSRDSKRPRLEPLPEPVEEDEQLPEGQTHPQKPWGKEKKPKPEMNKPIMDLENLNLDDFPEDEEPEDQEPPPPDEEIKPTATYSIISRITTLSQHYLTSESLPLRTRVLSLISHSTKTLAFHSRLYLPIINDLWPVVYDRLFDSEPGVVIQACLAISQLSETAGDFLATRVKDGWPGIKRAYIKAWTEVEKERKQGRAGIGRWGSGYKVWDAMVGMLVALVKHVGVTEEVADEMVGVVGAAVLREREDLRAALEEEVADSVWLEMTAGAEINWEEKLPQLEGARFVVPVF